MLLVGGIAFGVWWLNKTFTAWTADAANCTEQDVNGSCTPLVHVEQNVENNYLPEGSLNFWGAVAKIAIWLISGTLIVFGMKFYLEYRKNRVYTKEECIEAARKDLLASNYPVDGRKPKYDFQYAGADSEANPRWAFGFVEEGLDDTRAYQLPYHLVTCIVHAKTLEVTNQRHGRSWDQFLRELNEQRTGKWAVLNDAGKPQRDPSLADLFDRQPRVSVDVTPEDDA